MEFQSTLPHGERPLPAGKCPLFQSISIHAPARGATLLHSQPPCFQTISIHAPARGATYYCCGLRLCKYDFNPHSRTGSDRYRQLWVKLLQNFNPRSRTGSDFAVRRTLHLLLYFNPRSRTGSDVGREAHPAVRIQFQSTLPHGERPERQFHHLPHLPISIHAPARGAT